jgi:hypothetical protein
VINTPKYHPASEEIMKQIRFKSKGKIQSGCERRHAYWQRGFKGTFRGTLSFYLNRDDHGLGIPFKEKRG